MKMQPIEGSSNIHAIGWEDNTLRIQFHNKTGEVTATWDYADVQYETYEAMLAAPSVGKFFYANIKGVYTGTKVE